LARYFAGFLVAARRAAGFVAEDNAPFGSNHELDLPRWIVVSADGES
jgi:hypothetical protein